MQPHNADRSLRPEDQVDLAVEVFRMLADSTRVTLLWLPLDGALSVNELSAAPGKARTSVSQHLAKLRMARLVQTRRQGNQIFYRIESDHLRQRRVPEHHLHSPQSSNLTSL